MKKLVLFVTFMFFVAGAFTGSAYALTADDIFDEMEERQAEVTTSRSLGSLLVVDSRGREELREVIMYSQEEDDGTVSTIFRFLSPASVRNITLLSLNDGDQINLYMPAYRRVRRIAGAGRQETFAGTNFTYEDIGGGFEREDYEYELTGEDEENYIIELFPLDPESEYSRQVMKVDKELFFFSRIDFYDLEETLWRVLEVLEVEELEDGTVRFREISLSDVKENSRSVLKLEEIEDDIDLPANFFSVRTIQRPEL